MSHRVALVGLSGSGKSTVGRALALALDVPFTDLDQVIEAEAGVSIPVIFRKQGEAAFRRLESEALAREAALPGPRVLSPGGGIVLSAENRDLLRSQFTVIWLDATPSILADRLHGVENRPLLGEDRARDLMQQFEEREMFYLEVAHHRLESSHQTTQEGQVRRIRELLDRPSGD